MSCVDAPGNFVIKGHRRLPRTSVATWTGLSNLISNFEEELFSELYDNPKHNNGMLVEFDFKVPEFQLNLNKT